MEIHKLMKYFPPGLLDVVYHDNSRCPHNMPHNIPKALCFIIKPTNIVIYAL